MKFLYALVATLIATSTAIAQDFPNRPITWVVPFPPGGVTDNTARTVAKVMGEKLGQPVIVENKPGAGGIVGTEFVVNAKKDGYTILLSSNGIVTYPFLFKTLSYNPQKDLAPMHGFALSPMLIMVKADSPFKTLDDLIAFAKKNPNKLNYATVGSGSTQHLFGELLQKEAGFKMTAVPYKGSAPALTDLLAGVIDISLDYAVSVLPQIQAGKLRAIGVSGDPRLPVLPDVKSVSEYGYPNASFTAWSTVVLPAGTPQPIVDKLAKAFDDALEEPAVLKYFEEQSAPLMRGVGPAKLGEFFDKERAKMKAIVEITGIKPE